MTQIETAPAASMESIHDSPGVLLYTRIRKSAFYHASRHPRPLLYSTYNHNYHPRVYGDPVEEYWHLLNGVTLWDVAVEKQVEITGPDAFTFTNMLIPRDLNKCKVDQCKYVFITSHEGGILNDPVLLRLAENHFWISLADSDVLLWAWGVAYHSGLDVTIREPDVAPMQVQGPKSKEVMVDLFGESILDIPYYYLSHRELEGVPVIVSRTGYTSELGYEIYVTDASRNGPKIWDTVMEAGEPHGLKVIGPCHIRRIEGGILALGADMWYDTNPFEVDMGYEWMVDLNQEADFIGKEALKRIKAEGIKRKLVGVEIGGAQLGSYIDGTMADFFPVFAPGQDRQIGNVTSACYSPRLEKNIGFAMIPIEYAEMGTELETITPQAGRTSAVVVPKPFVDPGKEIPKG
ncbi:MAG TPA: glycine cleavage T C-terminal barrel domain-containing protein [Chloroflexota bacterium]|nr:glycine cleavage T C-terminal barrel domain-containing protein [Chloroflexota bacterium]